MPSWCIRPAASPAATSSTLEVEAEGHALLTTPGAAKWYRSAGPWAKQKLQFDVAGTLGMAAAETIVFDGALADLRCDIVLQAARATSAGRSLCLGRTGSGERFGTETRITQRAEEAVGRARAQIEGGGRLLRSPRASAAAACTARSSRASAETAMLRDGRTSRMTRLPGVLIATLPRRLERGGAAGRSRGSGRCCGPRRRPAGHRAAHLEHLKDFRMELTPREKDKLLIFTAGAARRAAQGARPEAQLSGGRRAASPRRSWKARATAAPSPS